MDPIIIVGSGLAGYTLAREFRKLDSTWPIVVMTRDDGCVYSKPMLSNAFSAGKTAAELATATAEKAARDMNITVLSGVEAIGIDAAGKTLLSTEGRYPYQSLVLALGAEPIRLPLEGDADAVHSVNDLADYGRFRNALQPGCRVAIIGSGLIGCEFANDLAAAGFAITVIGPSDYPLQPMLPRQAAEELHRTLGDLGVEWRLGCTATSATRKDTEVELALSDGTSAVVDVVLSAVGLRPRTALADDAGIKVNRGIMADEYLRTSDLHIYALGDCAEIQGRVMPYVMPIMHSARALAKTLAGTPTVAEFPHMPIAVKTTAYPIIVQPAPLGSTANWVTMESDNGLQLWQIDDTGKLLGFALTGSKTRQRVAMLAKLEQS